MSDEVWVLGGTGRTGRDAATRLVAGGLEVVLVGRDPARLDAAVAATGAARAVVAATPEEIGGAVRSGRPTVVVNTIGPFARTAPLLAEACLPHSSYLDLANDFVAAQAVFALHEQARAAGRTLVTGAGFGVLATEAVIAALVRPRPEPVRVRVTSVPSVALEAGPMGEALAATIIEGVPVGGRRFVDGRLVASAVGGDAGRLVLPDGTEVATGEWPSGDLIVAHRISGAGEVTAATTEVPTGRAVRVVVPVASVLLRVPPIRALAIRRLSRLRFADRDRPRKYSWGHAVAEWADGERREGWLRLGDASTFTAATMAAVATRIAHGEAAPGAYSPLAATSEGLLADLDAELLLE